MAGNKLLAAVGEQRSYHLDVCIALDSEGRFRRVHRRANASFASGTVNPA
jgi:hypothetical protein